MEMKEDSQSYAEGEDYRSEGGPISPVRPGTLYKGSQGTFDTQTNLRTSIQEL